MVRIHMQYGLCQYLPHFKIVTQIFWYILGGDPDSAERISTVDTDEEDEEEENKSENEGDFEFIHPSISSTR